MQPLVTGKNYCLRLADGRVLGHLLAERRVEDWVEGPFTPAPGFEEFRALFDREAELRRDQVIPLWEEAADAIEALNIQVLEEGGVAHPCLRIFVEGGEAVIGPALLGS